MGGGGTPPPPPPVVSGVAPLTVIDLTATLSLTTTVNVINLVLRDVVNVKLLVLDVKVEILGPLVSVLLIVRLSLAVEVLPALSVAVNV